MKPTWKDYVRVLLKGCLLFGAFIGLLFIGYHAISYFLTILYIFLITFCMVGLIFGIGEIAELTFWKPKDWK